MTSKSREWLKIPLELLVRPYDTMMFILHAALPEFRDGFNKTDSWRPICDFEEINILAKEVNWTYKNWRKPRQLGSIVFIAESVRVSNPTKVNKYRTVPFSKKVFVRNGRIDLEKETDEKVDIPSSTVGPRANGLHNRSRCCFSQRV